ncbi:MAG: class I SAM-dependent methyltransferase [Acidilobaceae archaeon]|nr:class I SAM-dependent methyltransferase [Acidilobaceae archaeon]MCX8165008.1 class I SAM-dependent methyltransferase [Acidilobaceae archaeon]MDW7974475.1 class I SAM-dependent methyltransferase [Sulfolobales archaeon]
MKSLAIQLLEESRSLGIPPISMEDGFVLMAEAFSVSSMGGKVFLDAGAGVGYSTLWIMGGMAGVCEGCKVIAIEHDRQRYERLKVNLSRVARELALEAEVVPLHGDALHHAERIEFLDYAFVDIEKPDYPKMLSILQNKLRPGGVALFHNALQPRPPDEFFSLASREPWKSKVIPTEAGIMLLRKR